jgi:hypothetical protein
LVGEGGEVAGLCVSGRRAMDGAFIDSLSKIYAKHGVAMPASVPTATGLVKMGAPPVASPAAASPSPEAE